MKKLLGTIFTMAIACIIYTTQPAQAQQSLAAEGCVFDYDAGCASKGSVSCTSCDSSGTEPVVIGKKPN